MKSNVFFLLILFSLNILRSSKDVDSMPVLSSPTNQYHTTLGSPDKNMVLKMLCNNWEFTIRCSRFYSWHKSWVIWQWLLCQIRDSRPNLEKNIGRYFGRCNMYRGTKLGSGESECTNIQQDTAHLSQTRDVDVCSSDVMENPILI